MSIRAESARGLAQARIGEVLDRHGLNHSVQTAMLRCLRENSRVTLNFHPDRPLADGQTVIEGLLREGNYRSQFLTGTSNGSRTAYPGGDRDLWERALFGGAYHEPGTHMKERPRYGGLNIMRHADGACPRFGSCYFELRPHVAPRCTFTWGDSHTGSQQVGTYDVIEPILAALLECVDATGAALGITGLDIPFLTEFLGNPGHLGGSMGGALDAYVEAQVHGDVSLERDVEALVVDPAFANTSTGDLMDKLCSRYGITLRSHRGFILATHEVPEDFRGPLMGPLASLLDENFARTRGVLDAFVLGRAAQSIQGDPGAWRQWGTSDEALQLIKQLWHVLVRFGHNTPGARSCRQRGE